MTTTQLFVYHCNKAYVWDGTSRNHDTWGPVSIASIPTTFSEPDRTWMGTENTRLNSVHGHFPLSNSPLVFKIFPYLSTRPHSNLWLGPLCFHHSSDKSGTIPFRALPQSCCLGNHYHCDVTCLSRVPIFWGTPLS
jgi:hypothetical protein